MRLTFKAFLTTVIVPVSIVLGADGNNFVEGSPSVDASNSIQTTYRASQLGCFQIHLQKLIHRLEVF